MWNLKDVDIKDLYKIKHFIEETPYCEVYSGIENSTSKLVNLSIYKTSEIGKDDLDENGNLKEIKFLEIAIDAFPKLITFGDFNYNSEDYRYIATEFVSGESVSDRIKRVGALDEYDSIKIGLKLCEIADKLHNKEKPVLLNGLSLENIVIDMSGDEEKIKLRNLINMRYSDENFKYNYLDGLNVNHVAPEIFDNIFTPKSDQYNIGTLIYQMLTGGLPYFNDDSINIKDTNARDKYFEFRNDSYKLSQNINEDLRTVLKRVLDKDAEKRFNSLSELSNYLNRERAVQGGAQQDNSNKPIVKRGNGFGDIAGMEELKSKLTLEILDVLKRPDHFKKYGVTIPNGMLLYGPPGCGKTFISEKFCEEAGFNFYLVKPSDVASTYVSGGEQKIGKLFNDAADNAPTVICFDEVDAVMPKRGSSEYDRATNARVNEYLTQINKCSERKIFVIATTNKPNIIDEAMLRTGRLEIQIYVPPPDVSARKKLFELYLKNRHSDPDLDFNKLASMTKNVVASDIEFIVNKSSHTAAIKEVPISMEILSNVAQNFKPSVNKEIIESYEKERIKFEDLGSKDSNTRRPIGFKRN